MAFDYLALADFVAYDLFTVVSANAMKNNVRKIAEDVFGDPDSNSDEIIYLQLGNGATDGGAVYFKGGTSIFMKHDGVDSLDFEGAQLVFNSGYTQPKKRSLFSFYDDNLFNIQSVNKYVPYNNVGAECGHVMERAGQLIAYSYQIYSTGASSPASVRMLFEKNEGAWITGTATISITAADQRSGTGQTYAMGAQTVANGDRIRCAIGPSGTPGNVTFYLAVNFEVAFD